MKADDRGNSGFRAPESDGLSDDQRRAAEEYERTGKIPRMITEGREPHMIGGAGYLRYRKVYSGADEAVISAVPYTGREDTAAA